MKPEQQRIKLAEWRGWMRGKWSVGARLQQPGWFNGKHYAWTPTDLPNYLSDLNAVHELEKRLTDGQWNEYEKNLIGACLLSGNRRYHGATAAQRCEALLKTLGLWEEETK